MISAAGNLAVWDLRAKPAIERAEAHLLREVRIEEDVDGVGFDRSKAVSSPFQLHWVLNDSRLLCITARSIFLLKAGKDTLQVTLRYGLLLYENESIIAKSCHVSCSDLVYLVSNVRIIALRLVPQIESKGVSTHVDGYSFSNILAIPHELHLSHRGVRTFLLESSQGESGVDPRESKIAIWNEDSLADTFNSRHPFDALST